jgi:hypothetical protein
MTVCLATRVLMESREILFLVKAEFGTKRASFIGSMLSNILNLFSSFNCPLGDKLSVEH